MEKSRLLKIAPIVLAFMLLVPVGAMASTYQYGSSTNNDYSVFSGNSAGWVNGVDYISQNIGTVPDSSTFTWYNEFHNANGGNPVLIQLTASNLVAGGTDTWSLGNLGPYSYTSNFQCYTGNAKAVSGNNKEILVQHVYNGPAATNNNQLYSAP